MRPDRTRIRRAGERAPALRSFWMTAFDGDEHLAGVCFTADAIDVVGYERRVAADYRAARDAGIACVRENIDWRREERGDRFDFETVRIRAACAKRTGIEIVWTLCRASWPRDVDIGSEQLIERFARFAHAAARAIAETPAASAPVYAPVSEISFLAWALADTELFGRQPPTVRDEAKLARRWVRAALAACDAVLEVDPRARFLHTEPVMRMAGADGGRLAVRNDIFDMLTGRLAAGLGGHPRYVDLVGVHYHHGTGSWRGAAGDRERQTFDDDARVALHRLLADVHARHGRPIIIAETGPANAGRAQWLRAFGAAIGETLEGGIPLIGACVCRATERPAWEDPRCWRARRLWDTLLVSDAPRAADSAYAEALRDVQARIRPLLASSRRRHA